MRALMAAATSAGLFYDALTALPGRQDLPVTVAAQAVQHSAYPTAYVDEEPLARLLLTDLAGGAVATAVGSSVVTGGAGAPIPLPT